MFAYVLIAAELILLLAVFYLVFIREPKPFELKENLWGQYGGIDPLDPLTSDGVNVVPPFASNVSYRVVEEAPRKISKRRRIRHHIKRVVRRTRHDVRRSLKSAESELKNGWNIRDDKPSMSRLGTLVATIGQLLTRLSVRLP